MKKKRSGNFGRSGRGSGGRESGDRPNLGRTHENFEDTPHRHTNTTTTHHTTQWGIRTKWSWARRGLSQRSPWPKKQDMKLSRRAAPLAKVSWVQRWFEKVWAQNGLIKKKGKQEAVWAKSGVGQKWSEKQKHGKNKSKEKNVLLSFTQQKCKNKFQNQKKNGKILSSLLPNQKKIWAMKLCVSCDHRPPTSTASTAWRPSANCSGFPSQKEEI